MPVVIKLTFPAGRYHATPWGRHVNEGVVEWPPSPWRLLRALVAVWKRTCPTIPEVQVKNILAALVYPPAFNLPPHRVAHTRHAMPMNVIARNYKPSQAERKAGKFQGDPSIVFDTFVSVGRRDPLFIGWPEVEMSFNDQSMLAKLLANLSSLGRAEGWVHAEIANHQPPWNCAPAPTTDPNPIPVFCPDPQTVFGVEHYPTHDTQKLAKGKINPADFLFDCPRWHLCLDTETIHRERWPTVPGAKWVNYTAPSEAASSPARRSPHDPPKHSIARFLIDGPVLPLVTETLPVAEAVRHQILCCLRRNYSRVLSGKDDEGQPLRSHGHAYFLPMDEDGDGKLDHVTVWASDGFGKAELAALYGARNIDFGAVGKLQLMLVGLGNRTDFTCDFLQPHTCWVSETPFVVTRHLKKRGQKRDDPKLFGRDQSTAFVQRVLEEEIDRLRQRRPELSALKGVTPLPDNRMAIARLRPLQFKRFRGKRSDDGGRRPAGGFRIEFSEPVFGPLCLGHSCHFGLGLFLPPRKR